MPNNPNARKQLSDGARRALDLYASDAACYFAVQLAISFWTFVLVLHVVLSR